MNALVPHTPQTGVDHYRQSTDAASVCKAIVVATATEIQGRKYVQVEGWQAIAIAHGCTGSARDVEEVPGGVRAIGEVRRMSDGQLIATAEGFVGEDEPTWFGGEVTTRWGKKTLPRRPAYAIRAMAQTRAVSRACRSAFAHVVVMMNAGLSTTPAEEVPLGGFDDEPVRNVTPTAAPKATPANDAPLKRSADGRLIPAEAKRQKIHEPLIAQIDCADWETLDDIEERFDELTKDHPAKWLDGYRDRIEARRRDLTPPSPDWEAREQAHVEDDDDIDAFPGDRRSPVAGRGDREAVA